MKKFVKKIYGKIIGRKKNVIDRNQHLIHQGVLSVGDGSEVRDLTVHAYAFNGQKPNITIGKDSMIYCQIELQSENAQVIIGDRVFIGTGTKIFCRNKVEIADDVMISWGCTLIDTNAHSLSSAERANDVVDWKKGWQFKNWDVAETRPINIMKKCWIGFNSIITKGVTLNEGCVVGCGSVVTKSFDTYSVIGGNPATFIKKTD